MEKTILCVPNETTIEAMEEAREGSGKCYDTVEEMFADIENSCFPIWNLENWKN